MSGDQIIYISTQPSVVKTIQTFTNSSNVTDDKYVTVYIFVTFTKARNKVSQN